MDDGYILRDFFFFNDFCNTQILSHWFSFSRLFSLLHRTEQVWLWSLGDAHTDFATEPPLEGLLQVTGSAGEGFLDAPGTPGAEMIGRDHRWPVKSSV